MAGEWMLHQMKSRGGSQSDYSDIMFGNVISEKPLKIQVSNRMILTEEFLILGRHVTKHKEKMIYHDYKNDADTVRTEDVMVDESLKQGDGVTMIRKDGGQQFYVLEKVSDEEM